MSDQQQPVEVPAAQKAWFESLPEEAQKAARRAELDTNLPVLALIMQEVGVPGICAWAAYLDVMESGSVDPFDMPEILAAAIPSLTTPRDKRIEELEGELDAAYIELADPYSDLNQRPRRHPEREGDDGGQG